jgi:phytoene dehydrogenase-like protein
MSIADLLDEYFESPQMKGVLSVSGVIGTWAGPRSPGTAYVMAHHKIGEADDGDLGSWGFPEGGMGGVTQALRRAAETNGVVVRTDAPVARIDVRNGRVRGVTLVSGEALRADVVVAATHPKITFCEQIDRAELPDEFVERIEQWKTRSGTVKVNLAVDRLPDFTAKPGFDPEVHGGTIVLAESLDDVEGAFQDAVAGRAAALPFADICIPSVFDHTLAPEGHHIVSMFTQWVPHTWSSKPNQQALDAYADRVVARVEEVAPGFTDSILHRQVIGPYEMEHEYGLVGGNIFHGELSPDQLFHMRPAPGYADFRTPITGLYQASSATHGGGGVTGIPGLHATGQIMRDRRRRGRRSRR